MRGTHPSTSVYRERSHRNRLTRTEAKEVLTVDDYGAIRRARRDGMSIRQIARQFEHSRKSVRHALSHAEPPPVPRTRERNAPLMGPVEPIIDQILIDDETAPPKQRHTAAQVFRRLRDEHGYRGGYAQVQLICSSIDVESAKRSSLWGIFPARPTARGRFWSHLRRLPRGPAANLLSRHHLGLLELSLRSDPAI